MKTLLASLGILISAGTTKAHREACHLIAAQYVRDNPALVLDARGEAL